MSNMLASIVVASHNRASRLQQTLQAIGDLAIGPHWSAELIVVDNASTDDTREIVERTELRNMPVQYAYEGRVGKSHALNRGLAISRGDVLLFTDDDVIPEVSWAQSMVGALQRGDCDAVTGEIRLAPQLVRPWQTPAHRRWMALSGDARPWNGIVELIGANMGFRREVLSRVGGFDTELGPGAIGLGEDTLFGLQLHHAGYRVAYASDAVVEHRFDEARLQRKYWLVEARKHGRQAAYRLYHWEHAGFRFPWLRSVYFSLKLVLRRWLTGVPSPETEGCALWEMGCVEHIEFCRQYRYEQKRPRKYARLGWQAPKGSNDTERVGTADA